MKLIPLNFLILVLLGLFSTPSPAQNEDRIFVTNEHFTFGSPDYFTVAVKLGDVDGDGDLDVFTSNGRHWARQDYIYINNGNGRLLTAHPVGELASGYEPTIIDINRNGILDIVVARDRIKNKYFLGLGGENLMAGLRSAPLGPQEASPLQT